MRPEGLGLDRRGVLAGGLLLLPVSARAAETPAQALAALEQRAGGRLGVFALDTGSGRTIGWRADQRFAMCSAFKLFLAGAVLARVDRGLERLDRQVALSRADVAPHSPVVEAHLVQGRATVEALCAGIVLQSDNGAANLLLKTVGGPAGLTAWLRRIGDPVTRLDRTEPTLNTAIDGDPRDTSTPAAMSRTAGKLLLGEVLSPASRKRLTDWALAVETGANRIRAGIPAAWRAGDKTGTGARGATNDVAVLWPPGRPPVLLTTFYVGSPAPVAAREAVLAAAARIVAARL